MLGCREKLPVRADNREEFRAWGIDAHNEVNRLLGHPLLTMAEADAKTRQKAEAQRVEIVYVPREPTWSQRIWEGIQWLAMGSLFVLILALVWWLMNRS